MIDATSSFSLDRTLTAQFCPEYRHTQQKQIPRSAAELSWRKRHGSGARDDSSLGSLGIAEDLLDALEIFFGIHSHSIKRSLSHVDLDSVIQKAQLLEALRAFECRFGP